MKSGSGEEEKEGLMILITGGCTNWPFGCGIVRSPPIPAHNQKPHFCTKGVSQATHNICSFTVEGEGARIL